MNSGEYMSLPSPSRAPVLTLFTSILNHFLSSLIVPVAPSMITLAIPSVNGMISAAVVSEHVMTMQFPCRFHLTAMTTWLSGAPFDLRSWLMSFTIVRLSSLNVVGVCAWWKTYYKACWIVCLVWVRHFRIMGNW